MAAAAFARPDKPKLNMAAITGALIPDFSLYALSMWSMYIQGNSPSYVFGTQYFSDQWQRIFAIDNSFLIWAAIIALAFYMKKEWLWVFGAAAFLHLCFDFPLHNDDARQHFWPLTNWVFFSPISYWDSNHHGDIVSAAEIGMCLVLLTVLWNRFKGPLARTLITIGAAIELVPAILFYLIF